MTIEQRDVIDAIGIEDETGDVVLTISDHLDWNDEGEHLLLLQEKINTYLRFVESGELIEVYSAAGERRPVISIVAKYPASAEGKRFLHIAHEKVTEAGIGFRFGVSGK